MLAFPATEQAREALVRLVRTKVRPAGDDDVRRSKPRFPVEGKLLVMRSEHPGGGVTLGEGMLLDLGELGLRIVWPGYLHVGTPCGCVTRNKCDELVEVQGRVMWCRHLQGRFHEVGVRLNSQIDPRDFVDSSLWKKIASTADTQSSTPLVGRALCHQADPFRRDLVSMLLSGCDLILEFASTAGEALDAARRSSLDVIITELPADVLELHAFIRKLRDERVHCPILLLVSEGAAADEAELLSMGVTRVLVGPLHSNIVQEALRKLLVERDDPTAGSSPIASTLKDAPEKAVWINRFVTTTKERGQTLLQSASGGNLAETQALCDGIASTAGSYGFPALAAVALAAIRAMAASGSVEESMPEIRALARVIARIRSV